MSHNHYEEASKHFKMAAEHFRYANKYYQDGNDEKAALHAHAAHGHQIIAREHAEEAAKLHCEKHTIE